MQISRIIETFRRRRMFVVMLIAAATASHARWLTIHNDFFQYDLDGKKAETRSGCLTKFGDTYYWYGCDAKMTNQTCYSSKDLLHWKNEGNMLTASSGTNRMDVLYNEKTKKYVMVLKWETPGSEWCNRGIATSNSPTGPYTKLFDSLVYGENTGDMSVFQDDDGKAYYCFEQWIGENNMNQQLSLMTPDYIGLEKSIQKWNSGDREAELIMKNHGKYYYMTSLMAGIDPSATKYWTAPAITGPWTTNLVSMITPNDPGNKSWDTQCDFVYPFKGTEDTLQMYCGDRWKRLSTARNGDYVWLPITFNSKDEVVVDYYQDWELDPDRGVWRTIDSKRNLALNKTATASSTSGSNSPNNVTNPSTWQNYENTKWVSSSSDPQWISVDLGSEMDVNRVILKWGDDYAKSFKIQVSTDNSAWTDVFSTTSGGARSVTDETFATTSARYVRMNGTLRGGSGGYSLFDFMVLNDSLPKVDTKFKSGKSALNSDVVLTCKGNVINYSMHSNNSVKIEVVDVRGMLVKVLVDGFRNKGVYEAALSPNLSSGIYIVNLTLGAKKIASEKVCVR
jgi:hypothetical protein